MCAEYVYKFLHLTHSIEIESMLIYVEDLDVDNKGLSCQGKVEMPPSGEIFRESGIVKPLRQG